MNFAAALHKVLMDGEGEYTITFKSPSSERAEIQELMGETEKQLKVIVTPVQARML